MSGEVLPTTPMPHRELCVVMSSYDDFDGVYFTVQALRLYHPDVADQVGVLVLDNHPGGPHSQALRELVVHIGVDRAQYLPFDGYSGTSVRDLAIRAANADIVMCVDSHVLLAPGALAAVLDYFNARPESLDMLQGPLLDDSLTGSIGTRLDPEWGGGMFGRWGHTEPNGAGEPFEIPMQGLGVFAMRAAAWPGFNSRFRGFGGEEGYIHEKVRRRGGRVLCHPALKWAHRFARPNGIAYTPSLEDRTRNYFIGWDELGWDRRPIVDHFRENYDDVAHLELVFHQCARQLASPFTYFDAVFSLNLDRDVERRQAASHRYAVLDIGWRVERVRALETADNHHRGCALSWRAMVDSARRRGYRHFLGLEDDAIFADDTIDTLRTAIAELEALEAEGFEWDVLFLGAVQHDGGHPLLPGCTALRPARAATCTHAVALHRRVFDRILAEIPDGGDDFDEWLVREVAIDQYLARRCSDGRFTALIVSPRVASQPALLNYDNADRARAEHFRI